MTTLPGMTPPDQKISRELKLGATPKEWVKWTLESFVEVNHGAARDYQRAIEESKREKIGYENLPNMEKQRERHQGIGDAWKAVLALLVASEFFA